jgi:hypothetical protein
MSREALHLYRAILRAARSPTIPRPVCRKVWQNVRLIFDLHRDIEDQARLQQLYGDGEAAVRVLRWLSGLEQVGW